MSLADVTPSDVCIERQRSLCGSLPFVVSLSNHSLYQDKKGVVRQALHERLFVIAFLVLH